MFSNLGSMATGAAKTAAKPATPTPTPTPAPAPASTAQSATPAPTSQPGMAIPRRSRFGHTRSFKSGGSTSSASKRADGIAKKGKTKGTFV